MENNKQPILAALERVRDQAAARAAKAIIYLQADAAEQHTNAVHRADGLLGASLELTPAASVTAEPAVWLWRGRILAGTVAILQGDPMAGKSSLALDLAARVSSGAPLPLDATGGEPRAVIIAGHEDTAGQVRARLQAAGADLDRVFLSRLPPRLPGQIDALQRAIETTSAGLVIMENTAEILDARAARVTAALAPLAEVAERTGATVLLLRHLTKGKGKDLYRGLGAISGSGVARTVLTLHNEHGRRTLSTITNADTEAPPVLVIDRGTEGRLLYSLQVQEGEQSGDSSEREISGQVSVLTHMEGPPASPPQ